MVIFEISTLLKLIVKYLTIQIVIDINIILRTFPLKIKFSS